MRWTKWIVIIIGLLIIVTPVFLYGYVKYKHDSLEKETFNYLISKGYEKKDIVKIESKIKKLSLFTAEVTFEDEPNITYDYKKDGTEIIQIGPTFNEDDYDFKHLE